jgi:dihydrodipicolinate synthase/N-acetylneuraminate lyase
MNNSFSFTGMMPAIMTPLDKRGGLSNDLLVQSAVRLVKDYGASAVVWAGSMGDWPMLDVADRMKGVCCLSHSRIPVIVGTGAQNVKDACKLAQHAGDAGAVALMIIPQQLRLVACPRAQKRFFTEVLKASNGLPSVVYNSSYYGFSMKGDMFRSLRDQFPNLVGFKEFGGPEALTHDYTEITGDDPELSLVVGLDTQVVHGFTKCKAKGAITGVGNVIPEAVSTLIRLCQEYQTNPSEQLLSRIEALDRIIMPLAEYDAGPHLVFYYKYLMTLQGYEGYERHIFQEDRLTAEQAREAKGRLEEFKMRWVQWN